MKTRGANTVEQYVHEPPAPLVVLRPSSLYLVNAHELHELRVALAHGHLPLDLEAKLERLAEGDLSHRFLARTCRLFMALLLAAQDGSFKDATAEQRERLVRILAYVRKNDDAIPDYRLDGFVDDQQEVRLAMTELHPLLKSFKVWRLRHQVPGMWDVT